MEERNMKNPCRPERRLSGEYPRETKRHVSVYKKPGNNVNIYSVELIMLENEIKEQEKILENLLIKRDSILRSEDTRIDSYFI